MRPDDQALLAELRQLWETADPPPPDLVTRTLFLLELDNLEFELMALRPTAAGATAEVRNAETASTITFAAESLTVMITVSESGADLHRLDGWIAPSAALRVELRTTAGVREQVADGDGRFVFDEVPSGLIQLVMHPTDGAGVRLLRPVVTPATKL